MNYSTKTKKTTFLVYQEVVIFIFSFLLLKVSKFSYNITLPVKFIYILELISL